MNPWEHSYLRHPQWQKVLAKLQLNRSKKNIMNPTDQYIKAQEFRTWLNQQPDDRVWDYSDTKRCVVCSFLTEVCGAPSSHACADRYGMVRGDFTPHPIPDWLVSALWRVRFDNPTRDRSNLITAAALKAVL